MYHKNFRLEMSSKFYDDFHNDNKMLGFCISGINLYTQNVHITLIFFLHQMM